MEINKETAMRLWNKSFGNETKVEDFAGRTIAKGAYNDRNSACGWNVDHVLPQSRGGVTADHNLVCCHILTNDEKADIFPCFKANGKTFEVVKVQNHYEIRQRGKRQETAPQSGGVDFFDAAAGMRLFKKLKNKQNKKRFVGTVFVRLGNVTNHAVVDFIDAFFDVENVSLGDKTSMWGVAVETQVTIYDYNISSKEDANALLDKCVLLNTYLSAYFMECGYIERYSVLYCLDYFDGTSTGFKNNFSSASLNCTNAVGATTQAEYNIFNGSMKNTIFVNELVLKNTDAGDDVERNSFAKYTEYDYVFPSLAERLRKEANGK